MKQEEDFDANLAGEEGDTEETKRSWFRRIKKGITTSTKDKKEAPDGLWTKCPHCRYTCTVTELRENLFVCPNCEYHHRIGSAEYFEIIFDKDSIQELFANIKSKDFLGFVDLKPYAQRLEETYAKSDIHDSITVAHGKLASMDMVIACMDFEFIGGSLGSVMGEKICRACDYCIEHKIPFMIINKSGGARMMESAFSLMQLAKTSGRLSLLSDAKIPYFSLCTDPTFGGTTASFAMLGDIIMGEPGALLALQDHGLSKKPLKKIFLRDFNEVNFCWNMVFLILLFQEKN